MVRFIHLCENKGDSISIETQPYMKPTEFGVVHKRLKGHPKERGLLLPWWWEAYYKNENGEEKVNNSGGQALKIE